MTTAGPVCIGRAARSDERLRSERRGDLTGIALGPAGEEAACCSWSVGRGGVVAVDDDLLRRRKEDMTGAEWATRPRGSEQARDQASGPRQGR